MKVSVLMLTYNHEKYIAQAIESVLMQQVNFDYELIIGDDCSFDNTQNIIREAQIKYPNIITPILKKQNIGANENYVDIFFRAKGKYIANLEGDDYWTDPYKLQKQVDFLEANPDYVISYTDYSQTVEGSGVFTERKNLYHKETLGIDDLLEHNYVSTLTCVFRNNLFKEFPKEFYNLKIGDWPLHMLNAKHGKIKYHKGWITGVYRIHDGGIWSGQQKITKYIAYAEVYEFFRQILEEKYHPKIKQKIIDYYYSVASLYIAKKKKEKANSIIKKIRKEGAIFNFKYLKIKLKFFILR